MRLITPRRVGIGALVSPGVRDRALSPALGVPPLWVAGVVVAVVAAFAGLAALAFEVGGVFWIFQPDGEGKPPAAFSAAVLASAGLLAVLGPVPGDRRAWAWRGLGAFLCWMAVDEALVMHERLQSATGVDWHTLYTPVILAGGVLWLAVGVALRGKTPIALWLAGAGCWACAQYFETLAWASDGTRVGNWRLLSTAEEALETLGSGAWLVALLLVMRAVGARGRT